MVHNLGLARAFFLITLELPRRLPFPSTVTSSWDAGESEVNSRPWDSEGSSLPPGPLSSLWPVAGWLRLKPSLVPHKQCIWNET